MLLLAWIFIKSLFSSDFILFFFFFLLIHTSSLFYQLELLLIMYVRTSLLLILDFLTSALIVSLVIIINTLIFTWSFMKYRFKKERRRRVQILPSDIRLPAFACPARLKMHVKSVMTRGLDIGQLTSKKKKSRSIRFLQSTIYAFSLINLATCVMQTCMSF